MADGELVEEEGMPPSAGERLREAREAAGMSLEDIATTTRIRPYPEGFLDWLPPMPIIVARRDQLKHFLS